jgi:RNA 3'-terminal phosphate cyclase (ATP)
MERSRSVRTAAEDRPMTSILTLDGAHGEGGGQILRTALSLSVITGRAVRLFNVRAHRPNPGLRPQHLSAVRAAAAICDAAVGHDVLGSTELLFRPAHRPKAGEYAFDVADAAAHGSAGSVTLILQTLMVPLAAAPGESRIVVRGGTHVEWSPPFDHLACAYVPTLCRLGLVVEVDLKRWGWYPVGGGEVACEIAGRPHGFDGHTGWAKPLSALSAGALTGIKGRAVAANLPAHIPQRMADRARSLLLDLNAPVEIEPLRVTAACPGAGIFLVAEYENLPAAFSAYGRQGKPSEAVAEEAVATLREHHASGAAVERYLADQILLPLAVASGPSEFTVSQPSNHLLTNAWAIGQFGIADISVESGPQCKVRVTPRSADH